ncbi:TlpA family protein disulfide reductase [Roseospira marina]|uniref:TlpA family protein disulfide reductase n=2 Tax=Roseospira marina TaxID=140057 RepID=A0A5M6ICX7_9PROT|nr:TlpA family protein disulfide reductase [Roseospira marina]
MLAVTALGGCEDRKEAANQEATGSAAPELVATTLAGDVVRLEDLRGKVVLVNFWLAECGPCLAELPDFDRYYQAHKHEGLEILAINMGQSEDAVRKAIRRIDVTFPMLADPLKITTTRYNVLAAPTSFLVDAEGRLVERINGPMNHQDLTNRLAPLLNDAPADGEAAPAQGDGNAAT